MDKKFYVYILQSENDLTKCYVGYTNDLNRRLEEHNTKTQVYSKRYAPWKMITYVSFSNQEKAKDFEKYLKSHSGKSFLNKRLV